MKKESGDYGCAIAVWVAMVILIGILIANIVTISNWSDLKEEWEGHCEGKCDQYSQCLELEHLEWRDTYCSRLAGCWSIFSSSDPEVDIKVRDVVTKLDSGGYIIDRTDNQPYDVIAGPVSCPSEFYPEK